MCIHIYVDMPELQKYLTYWPSDLLLLDKCSYCGCFGGPGIPQIWGRILEGSGDLLKCLYVGLPEYGGGISPGSRLLMRGLHRGYISSLRDGY